jgi:predicted RNA-binding protein YlxR (DUF448 family)
MGLNQGGHMRKHKNKIQMDSKWRVCLGNFLSKEERDQLSSFRISRQKDGKIVLDPQVEIPAREHWIYKKPKTLASLMRGMEDAKESLIVDLDIDFTKFLEDEDKEHVQN